MKTKILIFHPALAPYRVDFFNELNERFDVSFYFNHTNVLDQKFNQELLKGKCVFKSNYLLSGFEFLGRSFRTGIVKIIKHQNPQIIICSEYSPVTIIVFLYRFFFQRNLKLYTISDDSVDNSKNRKGLRLIVRNVISKNINGVIFPSQEVCNWYHDNVSTKTKTLELPIIHCDQVFRNELIKSIDTANKNISDFELSGKKVLLFVGRVVEEKNIGFLINVVSQLNSPDWRLIIVGDGTKKDELTTKVKQLNLTDKIIFTGRKEGADLVSWYNIGQLFILPSTFEPFGAVVNEALLGGCIVLCSNRAGASTLINDNNGKLFDPYDEKELLNYLENYLVDNEPLANKINHIRENKMPFAFTDKVHTLINNL